MMAKLMLLTRNDYVFVVGRYEFIKVFTTVTIKVITVKKSLINAIYYVRPFV